MKKIVFMGEALVDVLPQAPGLWRPVLGGSACNAALAGVRLGSRAAFAGRLSQDAQGARIAETLRVAGVDLGLCSRDPRPSPLSIVGIDSSNEPTFQIYLEGTAHAPPTLPADWMKDACHLHVSSFSAVLGDWGAASLAALEGARAAGLSTSYDINIRPRLLPERADVAERVAARIALAEIVKASLDDLAWLAPDTASEAIAADWAADGKRIVLLTEGAEGATLFCRDLRLKGAPQLIQVADTVAAGDTFVAAFLARMRARVGLGAGFGRRASAAALADGLRFANAAAALVCARAGADPPALNDVDVLLQNL